MKPRLRSPVWMTACLLGISIPAAALENPSFEKQTLSPWETMVSATHADKGPEAEIGLDTEIAHSGEQSLRLHGDAGTMKWFAVTQSMRVREGERYMLSGWVRTDRVRREARQYQNCGFLVQYLDQTGNVVKVGKYPAVGTEAVLGTQDWQRVDKVVRVPEGAVAAKVGCNLSLSGTAWFDDVALDLLPEGAWNTLKTRRFIYHWEGAGKPPAEAIEGNEQNLEKMESELGVKHEGPIHFYKYASPERIGELTGDPGNAHVENGNEIHSISWGDRHEVVHLLTARWGKGTALLGEGIAVYYAGWQGRDPDASVKELAAAGSLPDISRLVSTLEFRSLDDSVTYPEAGSWVKGLIEDHGVGMFRNLFKKTPLNPRVDEFDALMREVYGFGFEEYSDKWMEGLGL